MITTNILPRSGSLLAARPPFRRYASVQEWYLKACSEVRDVPEEKATASSSSSKSNIPKPHGVFRVDPSNSPSWPRPLKPPHQQATCTSEEWIKGTYSWLLEKHLDTLMWSERLPYMEKEIAKNREEYARKKLQRKREKRNAEYLDPIFTRLLWKRQVLRRRMRQQEAYEKGMEELPQSRAGKTFSACIFAWQDMKRDIAQWDPEKLNMDGEERRDSGEELKTSNEDKVTEDDRKD